MPPCASKSSPVFPGKLTPVVPGRTASVSASRQAILLAGGSIVLAGLAAYYNSFSAPFVFDDLTAIVANPTIRHLWPVGEALSPPHGTGVTVAGRPILNLSFAINYLFGGASPLGYHALKGVVHALAGLILFGVLRRTLELPAMRSVRSGLPARREHPATDALPHVRRAIR